MEGLLRILRRSRGPAGSRVRPGRDVLAAEQDGLTVLLDLRREVYIGLDEVGTTIWKEVAGGGTADSAAERVLESFDASADSVRADTYRFIDELVHRRLLVTSW